MDPFSHILKELLPPSLYFRYSLQISLLCTFICALWILQILRLTCLALAIINSLVKLISDSIFLLRKGRLSDALSFKIHGAMTTLLHSAQVYSDMFAAGVLGVLQMVGIMMWYATFAMSSVIPMPIYLTCPGLGVGIVCAVQVAFVPFAFLYEDSRKWIREMGRVPLKYPHIRGGCLGNKRKYVVRKIATLRPFTFYAGVADHRFFALRARTNITFNERMSSLTISALLAVPRMKKWELFCLII